MNPDVKLSDFAEFFGKTKEELFKGMITTVDNSVKRYIYGKVQPQCDADARRMYEQIEYSAMILGEIGDNYFSNIERQAKDIESNIGNYNIKDDLYIRYAPPLKYVNKQEKILDYGCGQSIYPLTLYFMGYHNITLVDVPSYHFNFLEFLCKKYGFSIKFISLEGEFANISESYDYIICTDVLEHCWDPIKVLRFLVSKVNPGKLMYISDFYDDAQGTDPFHLKHNFKYQDPKLKIRDYTNLGIELFSYEDNLLRTVWKKKV